MTCNKLLKEGQWWHFCGETDMGQTEPVQCTECGGQYELASPEKQAEHEAAKARAKANPSVEGYFNLYTGEGARNTIPHSIGDESNEKVWIKWRRGSETSLGWQPKWFMVKQDDGTFKQVDNPDYVEPPPSEPDEDDEPEAAGAWTYGGAPGVVTHLPCTHKPSWLKRKLGEWVTGFKWEDYK